MSLLISLLDKNVKILLNKKEIFIFVGIMAGYFAEKLITWSKTSKRSLPWVGEKNPYYIWLSEVILQQTRVEQGRSYFERFKSHFPTIFDLANASEDQVLKLWQGLGYYSRARNLHHSAKYIAYERDGVFPQTYEEILNLKGVGAYTASAIASFAYNLPHAVVDGNVTRVLARYHGIDDPVDDTRTRKLIARLADELLDRQQPGRYNQAMMDFGATVCTPRTPLCTSCPFAKDCLALRSGNVDRIPFKSKKIKKRNRYFNYLVFRSEDSVLIRKRESDDIWKHLYEFPLIESDRIFNKSDLVSHAFWRNLIRHAPHHVSAGSGKLKHILSHQTIYAKFFQISVDKQFFKNNNELLCVSIEKINTFAFPKLIDSYIQSLAIQ